MPDSAGPPPSNNPILSAYLSFVQTTPLVTRYIISLATFTYLISWFVDPTLALTCIPYFTILKLELYRAIISPILCTSILNLIFAYLSFVEHGRRLEFALGSSAFASLLFLLGVATNIAYITVCFLLYLFSGRNVMYLMGGSGSIWILILALIASECSKAPQGSKRRLFVVEVPTLYYRK